MRGVVSAACVALLILASCGAPAPPDGSQSGAGDSGDSAGNDGGAGGGDEGDDGSLVADQNAVPDELVVAPAPGADDDDLDALFEQVGATVRERLSAYSLTLIGFDPAERDDIRDALEDSPLIDQVGDNTVVDVTPPDDDPLAAQTWHLDALRVAAAHANLTNLAPVLVAFLDSGVDADHPALVDLLRDGGNTADGADGWEDSNGHGTAVAGLLADVLTNDGVNGEAWAGRLMPIKVTDADDQATSWSVAAGITLAVDAGAVVINVSVGPFQADDIVMQQAAQARARGALVFFAAGNDGARHDGDESDRALFINAVDEDLTRASFASYGEFIDLAAPGVDVHTAQLGGFFGGSSGTSFAAPLAAGTAALAWSVRPQLSPATVYGLLLSTAQDLGPAGEDIEYGAGLVDTAAAVELALIISEQADADPPTVTITRPDDNALVFGPTAVAAAVADDSDLAEVTLYIDGAAVATDQAAPYAFAFDTTDFAVGAHVLRVDAVDFAGNIGSAEIEVEFDDAEDATPPTIGLISPTEGATVRGVVTVLADASDDRLLAAAELRVDGVLVAEAALGAQRARIPLTWDSAASGSGTHTVTVRVSDASGNSSSASVEVVVGS